MGWFLVLAGMALLLDGTGRKATGFWGILGLIALYLVPFGIIALGVAVNQDWFACGK